MRRMFERKRMLFLAFSALLLGGSGCIKGKNTEERLSYEQAPQVNAPQVNAIESREEVLLVEDASLGLAEASPSDKTAVTTAMPIVQKPATGRMPAPHPRVAGAAPSMRMHVDMDRGPPLPDYAGTPREQYETLPENAVKLVSSEPVSTFSIDVDTGAYSNVRRFLNRGQLPPHGAVRTEELINYFPYKYALPQPTGGKLPPFGVTTEMAPSPWNANAKLIRIGIKASDTAVEKLPPAHLVFLVDVSGSMDSAERLPLVKSTLKLLVEQLRPQDKVSLVTYASGTQVVLEPTSGNQKAKISAAIERLQAGGSTAGASGIALAYEMAQQGFLDKGINRIILATDGDFNVGVTHFEQLKQMVAEKRKSGVTLTTLGYGVDNYNERLMEQLANAGNGNYAYVDSLREARKIMVEELSATLAVVAYDVKVQVEFNPERVSEYRLIGYENRALKREDFSNDKVDAGEIGSGHTVTALYEVVLKGDKGWVEPLRYQQAPAAAKDVRTEELAMLRIRYKETDTAPSQLLEFPLKAGLMKASLKEASEDFRFAAAVAAYGQILRDSKFVGNFTLSHVAELAHGAKGEDRLGLRAEFVQLVELAKSLQTKAPTRR